jgi:nitrite reductase/ring-hydroxylating ferredoxin subunit
MGGAVAREIEVGSAAELAPGVVRGAGRYAVGNADGELFAVTRRCRHLGADLANGSVDREGCLVCPWHGARYDVASGRMTRGPQGVFAKIPGVDPAYRLITRIVPLGRGVLVEREGTVFVRSHRGSDDDGRVR